MVECKSDQLVASGSGSGRVKKKKSCGGEMKGAGCADYHG